MASSKLYIKVFLLFFISKMICGNNIAQRLMEHFNDVKSECIDHEGHKRPECECSGLMMRGLADIGGNGEQKFAWSPKKANRESNSFSFSFLRKDQLFDRVAFSSGMIFYPHLKTPLGKKKFDVVCAFPVNAFTVSRGGHHACGQSRPDKLLGHTGGDGGSRQSQTDKLLSYSNFCHTQGIITLTKWIEHYKEISKYRDEEKFYAFYLMSLQCGFDMTSEEVDATEQFTLAIEAKKYLQENDKIYAFGYNEILIQAWDENKPAELPIEAFFYIINPEDEVKERKGKDEAIMYQQDYKAATGETVPIVGIRLPQKDQKDHPHLTVIELKV